MNVVVDKIVLVKVEVVVEVEVARVGGNGGCVVFRAGIAVVVADVVVLVVVVV